MHRNDFVGRLLGIVVFLVGVGLLAFVFSIAYGFFSSDIVGSHAIKDAGEPVATQLGRSAVDMLAKIGLLIVMTIVGSLIAGRGIQLYFASTGRHEAAPGKRTEIVE